MTDEEKDKNIATAWCYEYANSESFDIAHQAVLYGLAEGRCELLGIIQVKDKVIAKFKTQITELEKRINTLKIKNASLQKKNEQQAKQTESLKGEIRTLYSCNKQLNSMIGINNKCAREYINQIEKMNSCKEDIINSIKSEKAEIEWVKAHNGVAKFIGMQTVIDIINDKWELKE